MKAFTEFKLTKNCSLVFSVSFLLKDVTIRISISPILFLLLKISNNYTNYLNTKSLDISNVYYGIHSALKEN